MSFTYCHLLMRMDRMERKNLVAPDFSFETKITDRRTVRLERYLKNENPLFPYRTLFIFHRSTY